MNGNRNTDKSIICPQLNANVRIHLLVVCKDHQVLYLFYIIQIVSHSKNNSKLMSGAWT